jgi:hypothetical protein
MLDADFTWLCLMVVAKLAIVDGTFLILHARLDPSHMIKISLIK